MTKVITYNNIQLSFQADTSGIKASKSELAALTREVNAQRTPLEKFMRQLQVINEASAKMAPKDVDARLRAVTKRFIDAEAAAGNYNKALYTVSQLVPKLSGEMDRLAYETRKAELAKKEFAETERKAANRQLQAMVLQPAESAAILQMKQQLELAKEVAKQEQTLAEKQAGIKRTLLKQERDEYVNAHLDMLKSRQKLLQAHVFQPAESAKIIAAQAESLKVAERELQNQRMSAGLGIQIFDQSNKILSVRQKSVAAIEAENKALQAQKQNQDVILSLQKRLLDLQIPARSEQDKAALSRQAQIEQFRQLEFQKAAIQVQELKRRAAESMTAVDSNALKRIFENVRNNIQQHIILLNEVEAKERQITQRAREKTEAEKAAAEAIRAQSVALEKEIQKERDAAAAVQRRMNLYRQMPGFMAKERMGTLTGGTRDFLSGAAMGGLPGAMLLSMSKRMLGGFAAAAAVGGSLKAFSSLRDKLVLLEVQFGSTAVAAQKFAEIRRLAAESPLETSNLMSAAVSLAQYGFTAEQVMPVLKQLTAISSGNAMRMEGLARAFSQVKAAGRLMGQEMLQFVNAGFSPLAEMSRVTGIEMKQLKKLMEEGKISFLDVADSLKTATSEGGRFFGQIEKQAEELSAKFNNLKDSARQLLEMFGEELAPASKVVMDFMSFYLKMMTAGGRSTFRRIKEIFSDDGVDLKSLIEIQQNLENELIDVFAYRNNLYFGPMLEKDGVPYENLMIENAAYLTEQAQKALEKNTKAAKKFEEQLDSMTKISKLEDDIAKATMTERELKNREAASRLEDIKKEAMKRAEIEIQIDRLRRGLDFADGKVVEERTNLAIAKIDQAKKDLERLPFLDAAKKINEQERQKFLKDNPQVALMQQAKDIADMIRLNLINQDAGARALAEVMMENTEATKQQSQELPKTIQAGTVEAYQAMFGRDNTAKLQLAEQKKQVTKQGEAVELLKKIASKPGMKKV